VPASLLLSATFTALLEPHDCTTADPAWCETVRAADMIAWMATTVLLSLSVLTCSIGTTMIGLTPDARIARWLVRHWIVLIKPLAYFVAGVTFCLPVALSLRMWLLFPDNQLVASVLTAMACCLTLLYHEAWHPVAKRTMGVPWSQWLSANNGYCFALNGGGGTPSRTGWYNELESRGSLRASNAKLQSLPFL